MRALVAAVILGGTFGSASVTVESIDEIAMVVEIEVEVLDSAESVVAHLSFEDEEFTIPLLDRGNGTFGLQTELEPKNYALVFEVVGEGGERSEPTTLARMGAELGPEAAATTTTLSEDELSEESQQILWLAVALGAASLSLLAFWVLGSRDDDEVEEPAEKEGQDEAADEDE